MPWLEKEAQRKKGKAQYPTVKASIKDNCVMMSSLFVRKFPGGDQGQNKEGLRGLKIGLYYFEGG